MFILDVGNMRIFIVRGVKFVFTSSWNEGLRRKVNYMSKASMDPQLLE